MSTANLYTPPRADVEDVPDAQAEFQEPTILTWRGRIGRLRYLAYTMGAYLVLAVAMGIVAAVTRARIDSGPGAVLFWICVLGFLVFTTMASIQRAHDMDWSGWSVLMILIPFVGGIAGLVWLFKGGTQGPNGYGPPPTPNTWGVRILGSVVPAIAIIGIVAAIALPAYRDYTNRAQAAQVK